MLVINQIQEIVDAYRERYSVLTIPQLLDAKSKLITLCFTLANDVAESKKNSLMSTVFRKVEHHKRKSQMIEEGLTQGLAESKTLSQLAKEYGEEAEREATAFYYQQVLNVSYKLVDDLSQRVSVLKIELEKSKHI